MGEYLNYFKWAYLEINKNLINDRKSRR